MIGEVFEIKESIDEVMNLLLNFGKYRLDEIERMESSYLFYQLAKCYFETKSDCFFVKINGNEFTCSDMIRAMAFKELEKRGKAIITKDITKTSNYFENNSYEELIEIVRCPHNSAYKDVYIDKKYHDVEGTILIDIYVNSSINYIIRNFFENEHTYEGIKYKITYHYGESERNKPHNIIIMDKKDYIDLIDHYRRYDTTYITNDLNTRSLANCLEHHSSLIKSCLDDNLYTQAESIFLRENMEIKFY